MSDNLDTKKQTVDGNARKLLFWRILSAVLLLAVLALGTLLYLSEKGSPAALPSSPAETVSGEDAPAHPAEGYCLYCYPHEGDPIVVTVPRGESAALPAGPELAGYTFLGWADADGQIVTAEEVTPTGDLAYAAVYAIAFRDQGAESTHVPYLSIDDDQYFHPDETVTRGEAISLLYAFLDTNVVGSGSFADVPSDADCYTAAATLKDLGVIGGSRFHPDEPISLGDFFEILSHFFPRSSASYTFESIPQSAENYAAFCLAMDRGWIDETTLSPDQDLTRAEAAHIFNLLSGRGPVAEPDMAKVGTILDVSLRNKYFWDIAEAAIPHEASRGTEGETWVSSTPLARYEEGLFFIGTALHCVDAEGSALINESYGNFDFGPDGVITTGMPELDAYVQATFTELGLDPDSLDTEATLRTVFNYVTYHNSYLRLHYYEVGDISWVNDEAYHMFTEHKGNCYNYAAEFYVLAKALGYDAVIYSGTIDPEPTPHAWVEIEFDGVPYIFDTELEFTQVTIAHHGSSYFKAPYAKVETWYYFRG